MLNGCWGFSSERNFTVRIPCLTSNPSWIQCSVGRRQRLVVSWMFFISFCQRSQRHRIYHRGFYSGSQAQGHQLIFLILSYQEFIWNTLNYHENCMTTFNSIVIWKKREKAFNMEYIPLYNILIVGNWVAKLKNAFTLPFFNNVYFQLTNDFTN